MNAHASARLSPAWKRLTQPQRRFRVSKPHAALLVYCFMLLPMMRYAIHALTTRGRPFYCLVADAGWTTAGVYIALFFAYQAARYVDK